MSFCFLLDATQTPEAPAVLAQSIIEAANHFSKALTSQAEMTQRAWNQLQSVFEGNSKNLLQKDGENEIKRGVWDIEQSLGNMDTFLNVVDEV